MTRQHLLSLSRSKGVLLVGCGGLLLIGSPPADARITGLTNCATTSPYGSTSFGTAGTYEQIACTANGVVDPNDPLDAIIQDINLAPKVSGLVQYSMDVTILMPTTSVRAITSCCSMFPIATIGYCQEGSISVVPLPVLATAFCTARVS